VARIEKLFSYLYNAAKKISNHIVILTITSLLVLMFATNLLIQLTHKNEQFDELHRNAYGLMDSFIGEKETDFFNSEEGVPKIKDFYRKLNAEETFDYGVMTRQPVGIADLNLGTSYYHGYGTRPTEFINDNEYSSVQVNDVSLNRSAIDLTKGRFFNEEEYLYEDGKQLPVLIGADLKPYFDIGDEVNISYLGREMDYAVVGFLDEDSYIVDRNHFTVFLNKHFVLPAIDIVDDSGRVGRTFQQRVYLQNTNGVIYSDLAAIAIVDKIQRFSNELGIEPHYTLLNVPNINLLGLETRAIVLIFSIISVLLLIISIIVTMINLLSKTDIMMKNYAIHYICGARKRTLGSFIMLEMIVSFILGLMMVFLSQYFLFRSNPTNWYLITAILLLFVLTPIPSLVKIANMNIPEEMRR